MKLDNVRMVSEQKLTSLSKFLRSVANVDGNVKDIDVIAGL